MRKPRLLLPFVLGAALCTGGQVDAATHVGSGSALARTEATPSAVEAASLDAAVPARPSAPNGPSTFVLGVWTLVGLGVLRWRRRRFLAEHAAP